MNRLWVRLGLMISGVLFLVFFLQFLEIMLPDNHPEDLDNEPPKTEIARRLVDFMGLSLAVGLGGGLVIGRVISNPITKLAKAAHRVGAGEMNVRVPVRGSLEIQELAEAFNKMTDNLERAETQRNNLMADVSHELRTPLTVLESSLRAALDHVYNLDEADVANLYSQTRHLSRLVNDLRELSLAEAGQLHLEKHPTDLNELVEETLQALEPLASEKNVRLQNETGPLPEMEVDGIRIRQVLFNLIYNSLRHTPAGGVICITNHQNENDIQLRVQDSGEGMESEQLQAVFDRFYRGDRSRSRETGGTGLGLAIVKAIIEAHHGRVEAHSPGKGLGSTFIVTLPRQS